MSAPFLYGMVVPLAMFDLCLEACHRVSFWLLKIPRIPRASFIRIDRHRLPYLSLSQKLACAYCGYANGLVQYAARIAAEIETYFCPIKHRVTRGFTSPLHHTGFANYGDAATFQRQVTEFRHQLEDVTDDPSMNKQSP